MSLANDAQSSRSRTPSGPKDCCADNDCNCHVKTITYTEHHKTEPIGDPIVHEAIKILEGAARCLRERNKYNGNGRGFHDYLVPSGTEALLYSITENVLRLEATNELDKAHDLAGWVALHASWVRAGKPESRYAVVVRAAGRDAEHPRHKTVSPLNVEVAHDRQASDGDARQTRASA